MSTNIVFLYATTSQTLSDDYRPVWDLQKSPKDTSHISSQAAPPGWI